MIGEGLVVGDDQVSLLQLGAHVLLADGGVVAGLTGTNHAHAEEGRGAVGDGNGVGQGDDGQGDLKENLMLQNASCNLFENLTAISLYMVNFRVSCSMSFEKLTLDEIALSNFVDRN